MNIDSNQCVQFFFDPAIPYCWLASREFDRLLLAGLEIDCQPVAFAHLMSGIGERVEAESPAKRIYIHFDVYRLAAQRGYQLKGPPTAPFDSRRALLMCGALDCRDERLRFTREMLSACWERGADLTDPNVLDQIAVQCGLGERNLSAAADGAETRAKLFAATNAAISEGIFGLPMFRSKQGIFWGHDRIDSLLWCVEHPEMEDAMLQDVLHWSAAAQQRK